MTYDLHEYERYDFKKILWLSVIISILNVILLGYMILSSTVEAIRLLAIMVGIITVSNASMCIAIIRSYDGK